MSPKALNDNDRLVLKTIGGAERPMSAYDILAQARSSEVKAPTQVYRSLQKLEDHGLVHRIEALSAFVACADQHEQHHSPGFAICRTCSAVHEFEAASIRDMAQRFAGPQFAIESVSLEIFGQCESCK